MIKSFMGKYCKGCGAPLEESELEDAEKCACGAFPLCFACTMCESCAEDEQGAYDDDMETDDQEEVW